MIKPMLARGELRMVGATTLDEYRQHIREGRRTGAAFQQVMVGEPNVEDTIAILRGLKERYEVHHGVRIMDSALVAAAALSDRYITARFLPDKAIDLVDEAASGCGWRSTPARWRSTRSNGGASPGDRGDGAGQGGDPASRVRLSRCVPNWPRSVRPLTALTARWQNEKSSIDRVRELKEQLESLRGESNAPNATAISAVPPNCATAGSRAWRRNSPRPPNRPGTAR